MGTISPKKVSKYQRDAQKNPEYAPNGMTQMELFDPNG
jgi:hypothetical protein